MGGDGGQDQAGLPAAPLQPWEVPLTAWPRPGDPRPAPPTGSSTPAPAHHPARRGGRTTAAVATALVLVAGVAAATGYGVGGRADDARITALEEAVASLGEDLDDARAALDDALAGADDGGGTFDEAPAVDDVALATLVPDPASIVEDDGFVVESVSLGSSYGTFRVVARVRDEEGGRYADLSITLFAGEELVGVGYGYVDDSPEGRAFTVSFFSEDAYVAGVTGFEFQVDYAEKN